MTPFMVMFATAVIAVAPVGDAPAEEVAALVPVLRESFGCEVVTAPAVSLPARAWNAIRRQYLSTALLDALARAKRPEWERLLGVADVDLYVPSLNFVFGEGDSTRGVGILSLPACTGLPLSSGSGRRRKRSTSSGTRTD
jgi:predicted Zn-dependent protease